MCLTEISFTNCFLCETKKNNEKKKYAKRIKYPGKKLLYVCNTKQTKLKIKNLVLVVCKKVIKNNIANDTPSTARICTWTCLSNVTGEKTTSTPDNTDNKKFFVKKYASRYVQNPNNTNDENCVML